MSWRQSRLILLGLSMAIGAACSVARGDVRAIYAYNDLLWAATENGLLSWGFSDHGVIRYGQKDGLPSDDIRRMLQDGEGRLWAVTSRGLARLAESGWVNDPVVARVHTTFVDSKGDVWVSFDHFVACFLNEKWAVVDLGDGVVLGRGLFLEAGNGDMWVVASQTLYRIHQGQLHPWHAKDMGIDDDRGIFAAITEDLEGNIWVADHLGRIAAFNGVSWQAWSEQDGLVYECGSIEDAPSAANEFLVDGRNNVWAWGVNALNMYNGSVWRNFCSVSPTEDIAIDKQDNLWVASTSTSVGMAYFDGSSWITHEETVAVHPRKLFVDSRNRVWGLASLGIILYDSGVWEQWADPNVHAGLIYGITEVSPDHFWFLGPERVTRYKEGVWQSWGLDEIGLLNSLRDLQLLSQDRVAVRTEYGAAVFDGSRWYVLPLVSADIPTNIAQPRSLPETAALFQNYPNPFNAETVLRYALPQFTKVRLTIFDALGRAVKQLEDEQQEAGMHEVVWGGRNETGGLVGTGVYFGRLVADGFVHTHKMVLCR